MAAIGTLFPTLVDLAKKSNPDGGIASVIELLAKKNAFMQDLAFKPGNLPTGHRFSARTALPSPTWRKLNQGIAPSKGQTDIYEESCGMLEGLSKVDVALAELNGNAAGYRADEDNAFAQGFGLEIASALLYSSTQGGTLAGYVGGPEKIMGLTPRFNATSGNPASGQIIKADAGITACAANKGTSIWLVGWSPDSVYGIYPKNSVAGYKTEDLGKQLVRASNDTSAATAEFLAYVTHHKWSLGLCVQDYRYVARICNIDTAAWNGAITANTPDLANSMMDAIAAIFDMGSCQPVFYMTRGAFTMFNKQLKGKSANWLEYIERGGQLVPHFLGVPIRIVDALSQTEAVVS
jgi:hypothetical protein